MQNDDPRAELLARFAREHSLWVQVGHELGPETLDAVLRILGPGIISVPSRDQFWMSLERDLRNDRIRAEFRGNNIGELSEKFELNPRTIRRIVNGR